MGIDLSSFVGENHGIVLRYIPKSRIAIYAERHFTGKDNQKLVFDEKRNCNMVHETVPNSVPGVWAAMHSNDSGSTTHWDRGCFSIGDTPEEALERLQKKEFYIRKG